MKDIDSGTIPIFKELSRTFPWNFDAGKISLSERSEINPIITMCLYLGSPGSVSIEYVLDEIILVNLLNPSKSYFLFIYNSINS
jgi:hypothetical protein